MPVSSNAQKIYYSLILVPMWQLKLDQFFKSARTYRHHMLAAECIRIAHHGPDVFSSVRKFYQDWKIPLISPGIAAKTLLTYSGYLIVHGRLRDLSDVKIILLKEVGKMSTLSTTKGAEKALLRALETARKTKSVTKLAPILGKTTAAIRAMPITVKGISGWHPAVTLFDITGSISLGLHIMSQIGPIFLDKKIMEFAFLHSQNEKYISIKDRKSVSDILHKEKTPQNVLKKLKEAKENFENQRVETILLAAGMESIRLELNMR